MILYAGKKPRSEGGKAWMLYAANSVAGLAVFVGFILSGSHNSPLVAAIIFLPLCLILFYSIYWALRLWGS